MLTWSAGNAGTTHLGPDNCPPGEKVTPDIVRVCCILFDRFNLHFLRLAGLGVADDGKLTPECTNFIIPTVGTGNFSPVGTNMGLSWC